MLRLFLVIPFLMLITFCAPQADEITVIHNVNGYTMNEDGERLTFEAIAFENGIILETGSSSHILNEYPDAVTIDGEGNTMLPGLIDAHAHILGLGESLLNVNLAGAQSLDEALQRISDFAEEHPDHDWILGRGWNQTHWPENEFPTAADLDQVSDGRPIYLRRVDGHAAWVNTQALEISGIDSETPDPQGGAILKDDAGNPTGILIDRAMYIVQENIPEPDENFYREALDLSMASIRQHGITTVHDAGVSVDAFRLYREYADEEKLTLRIYGMISGAGITFEQLSVDGPVVGYADDMLHLKSVKMYSDGALGSRGAALKEEYSDDPGNYGLLFEEEEQFYEDIKNVSTAGFQASVHAIGDRANYTILNAFERVRDEFGEQGLRHRIEHSQIVDVEDIPRFAELNIIASMQPTHATSDMNMAEDRVGPVRILGGYAWRSFLDQGTVIASGSDFPVEDVNPFYGLYSSVYRADFEGNPEGGWYQSQAMTRDEALYAFTLGAAYAGHAETTTGSLEPGKYADFILTDQDFFEVDESQIWQTNVLETWVGGNQVFQAVHDFNGQ